MAKKKPTFFGLALRTIVLLAEASCATSACLVLTSGELSEDGAEFLATIGAFWLGLSVFTWIFATVAGWIGMTNIVKKAGWGFFGTLLGGPLLFVWMLLNHIIEFFRYIFAYIFGAAVDTPTNTPVASAKSNTETTQAKASNTAPYSGRGDYVKAIENALDEIGVEELDFSVPGGYAYPVRVERCSLRFQVPYSGGTVYVWGKIDLSASAESNVGARKRKIEEKLHRDVENALQRVNAQYKHAYPQYKTWDVKYLIEFSVS